MKKIVASWKWKDCEVTLKTTAGGYLINSFGPDFIPVRHFATILVNGERAWTKFFERIGAMIYFLLNEDKVLDNLFELP